MTTKRKIEILKKCRDWIADNGQLYGICTWFWIHCTENEKYKLNGKTTIEHHLGEVFTKHIPKGLDYCSLFAPLKDGDYQKYRIQIIDEMILELKTQLQ